MRRGRWAVAALTALGMTVAGTSFGGGADASSGDRCATVRPTDLASHGWANEPAGQHLLCTHADASLGLKRTYWIYVPAGWTPQTSWPLVVVLHGCTEQGPDIAYISRYDWVAYRHHAIVVYPNQADFSMTGTTTFDGNGSHCWNWFLPQGQNRDSGEPALIAGITRNATKSEHADRARVYVIGISAGGATADIMAATYPDLYAAAGILAGCEYRGLPCMGSPAAQPPQVSGLLAYQAAGAHARSVPFFVENGDADPAVPAGNAAEVAQQWQVTADYATHHGVLSRPVPPGPCATVSVVPSPAVNTSASPPIVYNPYDIEYFSADGGACPAATSPGKGLLGELWLVHGEAHAWPGGPQPTANELYSNPGGPNVAEYSYQFFLAHPCRLSAGVCAPGR